MYAFSFFAKFQICPGLNANEIQRHQNTHNSVKYENNMKMSDNPTKHEVLIKQYLR